MGETRLFREADISIPERDLRFKLQFKSVAEGFGNFRARRPIICVSKTMGGKTILAVDIIYNLAKDARYVYFVTETGKTLGDDITGQIPSYFFFNPGENCFQTISTIWGEIARRAESFRIDENVYKSIFTIMYPEIPVYDRVCEYVKGLKVGKNEFKVTVTEILNRLIIDKFKSDKSIKEKLENEYLPALEMNLLDIVYSCVSKSNKTLLILDDMTACFMRARMAKQTVAFRSQTMKQAEALSALVTDMLTRARHYNCVIVMFFHDINSFGMDQLEHVTNFMFFDEDAIQKALEKHKLKSMREPLNAIISQSKIFTERYSKFHALYFDSSEIRNSFITRATIHPESEQIILHPDVAKFHDILDRVKTMKIQPSTIEVKEEESSDPLVLDDIELE